VQISQKPVMANVGVADLQPQAITHTPKLRASHGSGLDKADSQAYPGPLVVPRGGGFSPTRRGVHLREALANLEQAESIVVCV
jgi:hypothetical protein